MPEPDKPINIIYPLDITLINGAVLSLIIFLLPEPRRIEITSVRGEPLPDPFPDDWLRQVAAMARYSTIEEAEPVYFKMTGKIIPEHLINFTAQEVQESLERYRVRLAALNRVGDAETTDSTE